MKPTNPTIRAKARKALDAARIAYHDAVATLQHFPTPYSLEAYKAANTRLLLAESMARAVAY